MRLRPHDRAIPARLIALLLGLLAAATAAAPARAQGVRPWTPPAADSLIAWSAEAKARFHQNLGDSAGGSNYRAYELVGLMGRRLLRSLGRENLVQAPAVKPVLDSLGVVTEVAVDPAAPSFVLLMVRNPYRHTADAVGFLCWYRGDDFRIQGAVFKGGHRPKIRVWWSGNPQYPYEWGVVDETRAGTQRLTLFWLSPSGGWWDLAQDEDRLPVLGEPGEAVWADLNSDGRPELVSWTRGKTDSLFIECSGCPRLLTERVFTEGRAGFELHDQRLLPSPYATLVYFVRLLLDRNLTAAGKLLRDPAKVDDALALGWGAKKGKGVWTVEYGESGQPWPRWLEVRFDGPQGVKRYVIHFGMREGHWVIEDWIEPRRPPAPDGVPGPPAPAKAAPAPKAPTKQAPGKTR